MGLRKRETATKYANEAYNMICSYGGNTTDLLNKKKIIDDGNFFVYLKDLADSVRPGAWLSNSTCELALHILRSEIRNQKKHLMPINLAVSLALQSNIFCTTVLKIL